MATALSPCREGSSELFDMSLAVGKHANCTQGGTCVMMGDDHSRIAAASKLAAKQIGCKVFKGSPYYRKEGVHAWTAVGRCNVSS